jgi:hypothetical protein
VLPSIQSFRRSALVYYPIRAAGSFNFKHHNSHRQINDLIILLQAFTKTGTLHRITALSISDLDSVFRHLEAIAPTLLSLPSIHQLELVLQHERLSPRVSIAVRGSMGAADFVAPRLLLLVDANTHTIAAQRDAIPLR